MPEIHTALTIGLRADSRGCLRWRPPVLHFFALGIHWGGNGLLPCDAFLGMKRMHGQYPLWLPGAWQEYFHTTWLLARCPQEQSSRPRVGEAPASRPGTSAAGSVSRCLVPGIVPHPNHTLPASRFHR